MFNNTFDSDPKDFAIPNSNSSDSLRENSQKPPLFFVQKDSLHNDENFFDDDNNNYDDILDIPEAKANYLFANQAENKLFDPSSDDSLSLSANFSLSALGLTNVSQLPITDDFTFVVGGREHHCNKFLASFISPFVTRLLLSDINAEKIEIDLQDEENYFDQIISLTKGNIIKITKQNATFLFKVAQILENHEMIESFYPHIPTLSEGNAVELYLQHLKYGLQTKEEVKFIASNFPKVPFKSIIKLNPTQLAEIVGSQDLRIRTEDSLFHVICDYIDFYGEESKFLLGYINLPYLSEDLIPQFLSLLDENCLNGMIWDTICERLKMEVNLKQKKKKKSKHSNQKDEDEEGQFNGILNHLKTQSKIDKFVQITSSSDKFNNVNVLANRNEEGYWSSFNLPNSWVKFYFKNKSIKLEEYTLETPQLPPNSGHMISWVLEASNDGRTWYSLDTQYTECFHKRKRTFYTFKCDHYSEYYRYFRIKQNGLNDKNDDTMILKAVEFFGSVKSKG